MAKALEIATGNEQINCWIITGTNWSVEIILDAQDSQFDAISQAMEAATHAVEVFKGIRKTPSLQMMPDCAPDEKPMIGTVLIAHQKNGDPDKAILIYTHVAMSNAGAYSDSIKMQEILKKQAEVILEQRRQEELAKQQKIAAAQLDEEIKTTVIKKGKIKKSNKKK
jgi:hypothetical protein